MTGRIFTAVTFAFALSACADSSNVPTESADVPSAPAFGVTVTQSHQDVGPIIDDNPCVGENVIFSGKVHSTLKTDDAGRYEVRTNFAGLKGVGQVTGNEYVLQQNSAVDFIDPPPGPISNIIKFRTRVVSRGGDANFYLTVERSFTAPPPVTTVISIKAECSGQN